MSLSDFLLDPFHGFANASAELTEYCQRLIL